MLDHKLEPKPVRRIEVITGTGGRRRFTDDEKAQIIDEALVPGAVVSAVEDFGKVDVDGSVSVLIRRSKSDPFGFGRVAWVPPDVMETVKDWTEAAGIENGFVLRAVFGEKITGEAIAPFSVSRRLKRLAEKAGLDHETVSRLSGYSLRVGAAQDMAEEGFDLLGAHDGRRMENGARGGTLCGGGEGEEGGRATTTVSIAVDLPPRPGPVHEPLRPLHS